MSAPECCDPGNLARYDAHWIASDPAVATVVDQDWHVSWSLRDTERLDQRIIDLPVVTVTIEEGDVPAPLGVTGVQDGAWRRTISGRGRVFGIRLRPVGLATVGWTVRLENQSCQRSPAVATIRMSRATWPVRRARSSMPAWTSSSATTPTSVWPRRSDLRIPVRS